MSALDNLRSKLDILGYRQSLPLSAVPLVRALFEDLVRTTESLRDAKLEIDKYLGEKTCWELGVEPYKCDNSRLLSQCNALNIELIKSKDEFEEKVCDYRQKIRNLETDKRHLEDHCIELENNVRELLTKSSGTTKTSKNDVNMSRKPFVSTVKTGKYLPNPSGTDAANTYRCTKCSSIVWSKHIDGKVQEVQLLQNELQAQNDQIACLKDKIESRDREINRLNDLLSGGRPAEALAKDCCYKNIGTLSEDVEVLQKEKVELLKKFRDAQDSMHEAMQRAIILEEKNKQLDKELKELEKIALTVENEANVDLSKKESQIVELQKELDKVKSDDGSKQMKDCKSLDDKRKLNEKLNALTHREKELTAEVDKLAKKNFKLKNKILTIQKDNALKDDMTVQDEEILRYRTERDFFQKEYLKMIEKSVSNKEAEMLKSQLESKDYELKMVTKELLQTRYQSSTTQIPEESRSTSSHSVQAAILRAERERDVVRDELHMIRIERDRLREKLEYANESQLSDRQRIDEETQKLRSKICNLEMEKREMMQSHVPERTHLALVKAELEEVRKRVQDLQTENHKLSTTNNQLRILQDQTEKALIDHQNRLVAAETNLETAECRLSTIGTARDSSRNEICAMKNEIFALKSNISALECEKDRAMAELDTKAEKIYSMENEMKTVIKQKQELQCQVKALEKKLGETTNDIQERETELHETSTESKMLRQQICSFKNARDQAIDENSRICNELAEVTSDLKQVKHKLKESEKEVERLKQKLQQYVQEVQRAEELLILKEQERDEMLDHYRSLSHDAVVLEGNNHSLEIEAAEQKRQLCDAELEVSTLKKELLIKENCIAKYEKQVSVLSCQISELQTELDQNNDEKRLLKVDLEATKELTEKLDVQRDKLKAEIEESKNIKNQLECENKDLRKKLMNFESQDKAALSSLEQLLATCRQELDLQRKTASQLSQEVRQKVAELEEQLCSERTKSLQNESLAKEYSVQIQELRQNITNDRFQLARSREESPRYPTL